MPLMRSKIFPGPQNLALFAAEAKGFFAAENIEADLQITVGSDEQRRTLANGDVEIIHSAVDNAVYMVEVDHTDIVIVCGGGTGMNELIVRPDIQSYEDIRGKTVVVDAAFTAYAFQLYTMLAMHGLRRGDYHILPKGGATQRLGAMRESSDHVAAMLNPPWNFVALDEGYKSFGTAVNAIGPYQGDGGFVRRDWAREHADTLTRYIRANIAGVRWSENPANRAEAVDILANRLAISTAVAARSVETAIGPDRGLAPDARFDWEGFRNLLAIRDKVTDTWKGGVPPAEKFVDLSYYDKALTTLA
jgi:ABC-type nitrate/sulfonate/bicarbonate transport system substrate-binding protein